MFITLPCLNKSVNHFLTSEKSSNGFVLPSAARWWHQKSTSHEIHIRYPGSCPKLPLMYCIGCRNSSKAILQIIVTARKWQFGTQTQAVSSCHGNFGLPRSLRPLAKLHAPNWIYEFKYGTMWFWDTAYWETGTHTFSDTA